MWDSVVRYLKIILALAACGIGVLGWWGYSVIYLHVALAEEQTRFFQEAQVEGLARRTPKEAREFMEAIRIYYPSGSKQKTGTRLDLVVERARSNAISQLEAHAARLETESGVK